MELLIMYSYLLLMNAITIGIIAFTPYWTRKTVQFGCSIPEAEFHTPLLRSMRRRYAGWMGSFGLLLLVVCSAIAAAVGPDRIAIVITANVIVVGLVSTFMYYYYHNKMKKLKAEKGWIGHGLRIVAVDTSFRKKLVISTSWYWLQIGVVAVNALVLALNYDKIPDVLNMHYDFEGNVTRTEPKSFGNVFMMSIIQIVIVGLFSSINVAIKKSKQQIDANNLQKSIGQNTRFRRSWSQFLFAMGLAMVLMFVFDQYSLLFSFDGNLVLAVNLLVPLAMVVGVVLLSIRTGQGGSNLAVEGTPSPEAVEPINDDKHWKLGMIYYNPDDPTLFLEKRVGIGWTVNFARPLAWVILLGPLVIAAVIIIAVETAS
ncbi:DUF1648 domain-containing protein [Paenibacillus contaminans]|nr:DUF5808 domain-containing protein [Paenibacillus contaminans]